MLEYEGLQNCDISIGIMAVNSEVGETGVVPLPQKIQRKLSHRPLGSLVTKNAERF